MPSSCAVADCKSSSRNTQNITFHGFPLKNNAVCKKWIYLCKRKDHINPKTARMCSEHFLPEDYERDLENELLGLPLRKRLRSTAIPSIFPLRNNKNKENISPRDIRASNRSRKSFVNEILKQHAFDNQNSVTLDEEVPILTCESGCQTIAYLEDLEIKLQKAKMTIDQKNKLIKRLKASNATKSMHLRKLREQNRLKTPTSKILTKTQERKLRQRNAHWTSSDIIRALSIRSISLKAYETAKSVWKLPLPSARTLRRWASNFTCSPGIMIDVLNIMKSQAESLEPLHRISCLSFDEMSLASNYLYDKATDSIISHSKVQVVLLRGLFQKWKQPIYFAFDTKITKSLLFEIIKHVEDTGFQVCSITSDMGAENRALWRELDIGINNTSFINPTTNRNVYVYADVPHMLKLLRNHILDDGVLLKNGEQIDKATFEKMLVHDNSELKLCPNFNHKIIEVTGAERMRVRPACQLFSNHVATFARKVSTNEVADFIGLVNDGFDILNSRVAFDEKNPLKSSYGWNLEEQNSILMNLKDMLQTSRFMIRDRKTGQKKPKTALLPCQIGFIVSVISTIAMLKDLQLQYPNINFIMTSRLNQDALESLFSRIRAYGGSNMHPSPVEFRYRLRLILLGSQIRAPRGTNVEYEENISLISAKLIERNKLVNIVQNESSSVTQGKVLRYRDTSDYLDKDTLFYLAGYIAWKIKRQVKGIYGVPTKHCTTGNWITMLSRGGLLTPSDTLHSWILKCNQCFVKLMSRHSAFKSNILQSLITDIKSACPEIKHEIIVEFVKIRIKIRTRFLNVSRGVSTSKINLKKAKQFARSRKKFLD